MEWTNVILRKVNIIKRSKAEISKEKRLHTFEVSFQASIQETQTFTGRMATQSSQCRNETCSRNLGMDSKCEQDRENSDIYGEDNNMIENCVLTNVDVGGENEKARDNYTRSETTDKSFESDKYIDCSTSGFDNFQNCIEKSNTVGQTNLGTDVIPKGTFKIPTLVHKETDKKSPELRSLRNKKEANGIEDSFVETGTKTRYNYQNKGEANSGFFTNGPLNKGTMSKYAEEVNNLPGSGYFRMHDCSRGMNKNNNMETEIGVKHYYKYNIPLANREGNKIKFNECDLKHSQNEIKRNKFKKVTLRKSVTDLITFFESLNTPKQSDTKPQNIKSKRKAFESKQDLINEHLLRMDKDIDSNDKQSLSMPQIIDAKISDGSRPVKTNSEDITLGVKAHTEEILQPPTTEYGICPYCKEKCVHFGKSKNFSASAAKKAKQHLFIFSDDVLKGIGNSRVGGPRRLRSRLTRLVCNPSSQRSFSELRDSRTDDKANSSSCYNKANESGNFSNSDTSQTEIKSSSTDNASGLPLKENILEEREQKEKGISKIKKYNSSVKHSKMKSFIGILFTVMIFAIFCKGVLDNCNVG